MPIDVIEYKGHTYPSFQTEGNAAQFIIPFAKKVCKGIGIDVGCKYREWAFPNSIPIDLDFNELDERGQLLQALNLPSGKFDYIFSSHCLEHINDWVGVLDYWKTKLIEGGVMFLYLPDYSQEYWRVWNNRKHIHQLHPTLLKDFLVDRGWKNIFVSEVDLNNSFCVMAENNG